MHEANVFILGAGLGTRLRPLTENTPKPLIKLLNKEVINYNFELFYQKGYRDFVVNISYLKEKFLNFVPRLPVNIKYSVEDKPLGTGGGVKQAKKYFNTNADTIIMNGDILYDFDISKLTESYLSKKFPLATMVLRPSKDGNITARDGIITSIRNMKSNIYSSSDLKYKFTGLHIISSSFLNLINDFCIINTYIKSLNTNRIFAYVDDGSNYWADIGTIASYENTSKFLLKNKDNLTYLKVE